MIKGLINFAKNKGKSGGLKNAMAWLFGIKNAILESRHEYQSCMTKAFQLADLQGRPQTKQLKKLE